MIGAIHFDKLNKIGYGNALFSTSFHQVTEDNDIELIPSLGSTFCTLSECGFICEENQSVESINLAENGTLTLGDYLLRINGLLESCIDQYSEYQLVSCIPITKMLKYIYKVLYASSLEDRLLCEFGYNLSDILSLNEEDRNEDKNENKDQNNKNINVKDLYLKICKSQLTGLSGGQQQRLRLSSLFLIERIRYDLRFQKLPSPPLSSSINEIEHHPMQLLVLDEPDHHFDDDFFIVLSRLLSTLDFNHQESLITIAVLHKELHEERLTKLFKDESKEFFPKLRVLKMKSLGFIDRNDVEMEIKYPLLKEAFLQYDIIKERSKSQHQNQIISSSILEESSLLVS